MSVKNRQRAAVLGLCAVLAGGCATPNTVESRKQERLGAYRELAPETRHLVDDGRIKAGMSMDAVYIAWGQPSQILVGESAAGTVVTWLYHGTYLQEYRYWTYRNYCYRGHYFPSPSLEYDYMPRSYVRGEVIFENGLVKEWRSLPRPY